MNIALVTQRVTIDPHHGERRDALDQRWTPFLAACGLLTVPVPNSPEQALQLAEAMKPALIVFSGGNDLVAYGGDAPERDATETALLAWGRAKAVPVLGICRGMQLIQHVFGVPLGKVPDHVAVRHHVADESGPLRQVNSYHCFAASQSGSELLTRSSTSDGVVEAVSHRTDAVAGFMWHPEREAEFAAEDIALVRHFLSTGKIELKS